MIVAIFTPHGRGLRSATASAGLCYGRRIDGVRPADVTPDQLVRMMVGRTVDMTYPRNFADKPGELLLQVKGLTSTTGISDINIEVRRGEIVGLCGTVEIRPQRGRAHDLRRRSSRLGWIVFDER